MMRVDRSLVMGSNRSRFVSPDRPVERVSWEEARAFAERASSRAGLALRLPSEAEWEWASRAGTETATYAGPIEILGENNAPIVDAIAWYGGNSGVEFDLEDGYDSSNWPEKQHAHAKAGTRLVGLKKPNGFGPRDMLGNVFEWCEDRWHDGYDGAPADGSAWTRGGVAGRVVRGGSWDAHARLVRSAFRLRVEPSHRRDYLGFRCAVGQRRSRYFLLVVGSELCDEFLPICPRRAGAVLERGGEVASKRPYFTFSIAALEKLIEDKADHRELRAVAAELKHRTKPRAVALRARVHEALAAQKSAPVDGRPGGAQATKRHPPTQNLDHSAPLPPNGEPNAASVAKSVQEARPGLSATLAFAERPSPYVAPPRKKLSNKPADILRFWTALEVLSPHSYARPEELVDDDPRRVARLDHGLPWTGGGEKSRPNSKLFYQLALGSLRLDQAEADLEAIYGALDDPPPRRPRFSALAFVTLDQKGRVVGDNAVAVSSFAWAFDVARQGRLERLSEWPKVETKLVRGLEERLRKEDENGDSVPLDHAVIEAAFAWLVDACALAPAIVEQPRFALRAYQWFKIDDAPDPPLLNSFYLADLAKAGEAVAAKAAPDPLARYLGMKQPAEHVDFLADREALADRVRASEAPAARWPGPGRHSLVLLQQAAVNAAMRETREGGLFAVNGPPGTGKTTLLRDLVAGILFERAEAMATFDDPEKAFRHSGEKVRVGSWTHLYEVSPKIAGREILVASSNNKAVENISKELPARAALAEDLTLDFFAFVGDGLLGEEGASWGTIAAVLGKAANRFAFADVFWNQDERSLKHYLAAATSKPVLLERKNEKTGETEKFTPSIIEQCRPPADHADALGRWKQARAAFRKAAKRVEERLARIERASVAAARLDALGAESDTAREVARALEQKLASAEKRVNATVAELNALSPRLDAVARALDDHRRKSPNWLARLSGSASAKSWTAEHDRLTDVQTAMRRHGEDRRRMRERFERERNDARDEMRRAIATASRLDSAYEAARADVDAIRSELGEAWADDAFWRRDHAVLQKVTPWLDPTTQSLRDEAFVAAIKLHRAFVDAAAKPLRNNLMALFSTFRGVALGAEEKEALRRHLWASLFLLTPVVSTTFASLGRMLHFMPEGGVGWLFVDEAGQATPQAPVGGLMRAKRAVIVGDPLQLEPINPLPPALVDGLARAHGVDATLWAPPDASAQSLADRASKIGGLLETATERLWIGSPLLVHRRCAEPMFGVANAVAYGGQMVHATPHRPSVIVDTLGPSRWFAVESAAAGKWVEEEGDLVEEIIAKLTAAQGALPDLYVITPFRAVSSKLRDRFARKDGPIARYDPKPWRWVGGRVGTIHTFQGKEAEAVLLVLGAASPDQKGARAWAGGSPNLLNVAVSRAKAALYVVGSREAWRGEGVFATLDRALP